MREPCDPCAVVCPYQEDYAFRWLILLEPGEDQDLLIPNLHPVASKLLEGSPSKYHSFRVVLEHD